MEWSPRANGSHFKQHVLVFLHRLRFDLLSELNDRLEVSASILLSILSDAAV